MGRLVLIVAALIVAAWFAIGTRQAVDTDRAAAIVSGSAHLSRGQARQADSLLRAAAFLNPDTHVQLLRSQVALARGDKPLAHRLAASVTRSEPMNAEAWVALARSSSRAGFLQALKRVAELAPPVGHTH